jgi:hypothetical protein
MMDITHRLVKKVALAHLRVKQPITEAELASFELAVGATMPNDYREFLLHVANGGNDPCRLLSLAGWHRCYWIDNPQPTMVAAPCLITPAASEEGANWLDSIGVTDWQASWDNGKWDPMFGTIAIAEIGCGLFYSMIITGPHRGRIFSWGDHALNPPYIYPEASFGEWFEKSLDATIAGESVHFLTGRLK